MEFEVFEFATGRTFKKTITPLSKALRFMERAKYSKKILILNSKYI